MYMWEHTVFAHIHVHTYGYFLATCLYTVTPSPITLTHSHPHTSATFQFLLSRVNLLSALTLHLQDERSQLLVCTSDKSHTHVKINSPTPLLSISVFLPFLSFFKELDNDTVLLVSWSSSGQGGLITGVVLNTSPQRPHWNSLRHMTTSFFMCALVYGFFLHAKFLFSAAVYICLSLPRIVTHVDECTDMHTHSQHIIQMQACVQLLEGKIETSLGEGSYTHSLTHLIKRILNFLLET